MIRNIVLFCAGGMSTSLLVNKMRVVAKEQDYRCEIEAYSVGEVERRGKDASIVLIGPQVRFHLDKIRKQLPGIPVEVIDMRDYGRMDGAAIISFVKEKLGD